MPLGLMLFQTYISFFYRKQWDFELNVLYEITNNWELKFRVSKGTIKVP